MTNRIDDTKPKNTNRICEHPVVRYRLLYLPLLIALSIWLKIPEMLIISCSFLAFFEYLSAFVSVDFPVNPWDLFFNKLGRISQALVLVGLQFSLLHWPRSQMFLLMGGIMEGVAATYSVYGIMNRKEETIISTSRTVQFALYALAAWILYFNPEIITLNGGGS